jgi:hypothetical protein
MSTFGAAQVKWLTHSIKIRISFSLSLAFRNMDNILAIAHKRLKKWKFSRRRAKRVEARNHVTHDSYQNMVWGQLWRNLLLVRMRKLFFRISDPWISRRCMDRPLIQVGKRKWLSRNDQMAGLLFSGLSKRNTPL